MWPKFKFPYTNFHALNLDWIIGKLKQAVFSVNGIAPDNDGNVDIPRIIGVSSVNGVVADGNGNVSLPISSIPGGISTVNNIGPDARGNVNLPISPSGGGDVSSVNSIRPDSSGNVQLPITSIPGGVASVNNIGPDLAGNITLPSVSGVTSVNDVLPDSNGNVTIDIPSMTGVVYSVNGISPNADGNVSLPQIDFVYAEQILGEYPGDTSYIYKSVTPNPSSLPYSADILAIIPLGLNTNDITNVKAIFLSAYPMNGAYSPFGLRFYLQGGGANTYTVSLQYILVIKPSSTS